MSEHSQLGASSAARWLVCPASVALCATLPDTETPAAREGSAAHELAQMCLDLGFAPADFVGGVRTLKEYADVKVTKEMADAVSIYVDYCRALAETADKVWVENRFVLSDFDAELYGRNDFAAWNSATGVLEVVDYKHGVGVPVDADDNPQLKYYALGALMSIEGGVSHVKITVIQPRLPGADPIKSAEFDPMTLLEFGDTLARGAAATRGANPPFVSGRHCRKTFCKGQATCPKLREEAEAVAAADFAAGGEMDAGQMLELADRLAAWAKAVKADAYRQALAGNCPVGWKLVRGKSRRAWANPSVIADAAALEFGGDRSEYVTETPMSPSQIEKKVGKKAASEFVAAGLAAPKTSYALAPASDKRAAVEPPSDADFAMMALEEDESE